ncbi:MAG: membrane integrity-associated transporter subunit PqiC [Proteobacteria bacterium]|nr:membrane integrity-associated transporter subunit PqiC [Pseudomonadota bacterium]MBU1739201.1 membrane integrity-associated transporter subunit PqiC [Pseudomonadota bacterium]
MTRHTLILPALSLILLCTGCMDLKQTYQPTAFYSLEYAPPDPGAKEQLPFSIRVERFTTAPDLNSGRIIYRSDPYKREAYIYHRWRSSPGDLVRYLLARDLSASGLFAAVFTNASNLKSSIAIEGVIDEFYEWDSDDDTEAVISISVTVLTDQEESLQRLIVLQEKFTSRQPCRERSAPALVEAMSRAMADISSRLTDRIYQELEKAKSDR